MGHGDASSNLSGCFPPLMLGHGANDLTEPLKKRVGGSLSRLPPLQRLEMLQRNLLMLRGGKWSPPQDDGTLVRKILVLVV